MTGKKKKNRSALHQGIVRQWSHRNHMCSPFRGKFTDVLTKGLPTKWFHDLTSTLRMIDIYSPAWERVL